MSIAPLDPRRERASLFLLTAAQFTHIVDFMILMPLGPQLMRSFGIDASHFGWLVSVYTFSAGAAGFIATLFLDRFDRKHSFLWLYAGFALATLSCAFAPNFYLLLLARIVAGAFGGVTNSQVLAIVSDLVPLERRGRAIGIIMSGFSLASIFGVPAGLALAGDGNWHTPFVALAGIAVLVLVAIARVLPSLPPHEAPEGWSVMGRQFFNAFVAFGNFTVSRTPLRSAGSPRSWREVIEELPVVVRESNHLRAFAFMIGLSLAAFMIFPYISPSLVANCGYPEKWLLLVYIVGGAVTIFVTNFSGRAADRFGRLRIFRIAALASIVPMLVLTHLTVVPMWVAIATVTLFMSLSSARFVPAMAMITGSVQPRYRAGFMSLNSALQQCAGGISVTIAALVVKQDAAGHILNYGLLGWISAGLVLLTLFLAGRVRVAELPAGYITAPASAPAPARAD